VKPFRKAFRLCALLGLLFAGCSSEVGSIPGVFTTGDIRILGLDPDFRECVVSEGIWLALLGENLGTEEAWAAGEHRVIFPPDPPGIASEQVQLVGNALFVLVPRGIRSGVLTVDAGASGAASIAIVVEGTDTTELGARMVGTICPTNPPPAQ
jgi:hypothetical protein